MNRYKLVVAYGDPQLDDQVVRVFEGEKLTKIGVEVLRVEEEDNLFPSRWKMIIYNEKGEEIGNGGNSGPNARPSLFQFMEDICPDVGRIFSYAKMTMDILGKLP